MAASIMKQLSEGLERIDRRCLPVKFKVWCYQFSLYNHLMWPLNNVRNHQVHSSEDGH